MQAAAIKGHKKKPLTISLIGISYLVLPALTLFQVSSEFGYSAPLLKAFVASDFFLLDLFCSVTAGLAVLIVTKWSLLYFLVLSAYTLGLKIHHLRNHVLFESTFEVLVIAFWLAMTLILFTSNLRVPYLNPRVRWWTQPTRFSMATRGTLSAHGVRYPIVTLNVSLGGVFVRQDDSAGLTGFPSTLGEKVHLSLECSPEIQPPPLTSPLEIDAEVVWASTSRGPYPHGLGLKFISPKSSYRKQLRHFLKALPAAVGSSGAR